MPRCGPARIPLLFLLVSPLIAWPMAADADVRLLATGGIHSPTGGDEREVFGLAPQFGLGIVSDFADGASAVGLDLGYVRSGGREQELPTFDIPESHYTLFPITLSITTFLADGDRQDWPKVYVGFFVTVIPTRYTDRGGDDFSTPTMGGGLELRPEFRLADGWRGFGRTRLQLVDGVDYRNAVSNINYSALTLEFGVSTGLR